MMTRLDLRPDHDAYLRDVGLVTCPRCGRRHNDHRNDHRRQRRRDHRGWGPNTCDDCRDVTMPGESNVINRRPDPTDDDRPDDGTTTDDQGGREIMGLSDTSDTVESSPAPLDRRQTLEDR